MSDPHSLPPAPTEKDQKIVNRIYAALTAALIFMCVPNQIFAVVSSVLMLYAIFAAYATRRSASPDSLSANHMTYLIRSFWASSLLFLIGFVAAGFYLGPRIAPDAWTELAAMAEAGQLTMTDDLRLISTVSLIALGPSLIYFIYRIASGLSRAARGHRIGNPLSWF